MTHGIPPGDDRVRELLERKGDGFPVSIDALRAAALDRVDDDIASYLEAGAGDGRTVTHNRRGFERWRIIPHVLRDVRERTHETTILGRDIPAPVYLAPIGFQCLFHPEGELATSRGAATLGLAMATSSFATTSLEDVQAESGQAPTWFQLYASTDDAVTTSLIERAETADYDALCVTVDAHGFGWREQLLDSGFNLINSVDPANFYTDPAFREAIERPPEEDPDTAAAHFHDVAGPAVVAGDDLEQIVASTTLPVVVKGVLDPDDAETAIDHGADGVIVSNHGGRMVDNAIAAIDALPAVVERIGERAMIGFDSGIRRGADGFVALALGADIVGLGRPYLYGLIEGGERGVEEVLRNFLGDLDMTLALAGHTDWSSVDATSVTRQPR